MSQIIRFDAFSHVWTFVNPYFTRYLTFLVALCSSLICHAENAASNGDTWLSGKVVSTVGQVEFRECELEFDQYRRNAECAYVEVSENTDDQQGDSIAIFVARLPSSNTKPKSDPILAIAGGPGQAASDAYILADRMWRKAGQSRDFYLIDQRGTGRSNKQSCDAVDMEEMSSDLSKDKVQALTKTCLESLSDGIRFYSTSAAISDFEAVRRALEVKQWNVIGVSYGTMVAQHYMKRYPSALRTVVLDSVAPVSEHLGVLIPKYSQAALDWAFMRCEQDAVCHAHFPELREGTYGLLDKLKAQSIKVTLEDLKSGKLIESELTHDGVVALLRMHLYRTESTAILPPMLHEAYAKKNYAPLTRSVNNLKEKMDGMFAIGMHNAVICTESVPFFTPQSIADGQMDKTYMGSIIIDWLQWSCAVWPKGVIDTDFKQPVESVIPTLLLSGEVDPITPPNFAETVKAGLSNAVHYVLPGQGHFVSATGCAPTMVAKFFDEASVSQLKGECFERLRAAPMFIDFNGPAP